jgi:hypothetical protein
MTEGRGGKPVIPGTEAPVVKVVIPMARYAKPVIPKEAWRQRNLSWVSRGLMQR